MKTSKSAVLEHVIAPIVAAGLALPFKEDDARYGAMIDLWCEELAFFDTEVLAAGARPFIRNYRKPFRLTLADLLSHFEDIKRRRNPKSALPSPLRHGRSEADRQELTPEELALGRAFMSLTKEWLKSGEIKHRTADDARDEARRRVGDRAA